MDEQWQAKLAYLADILGHFNKLNIKLQGRNENILSSTDKIGGFMCKLHGHVPTDISCATSSQGVCCICQTPSEIIKCYVPCAADIEDNDWIRDPFNQKSSTEKLILREKCAE